MNKTVIVGVALPLLVMGCSSSSGAGFESRASEAEALYFEVLALDATDVMPNTGTDARYDGYIAFNVFPLVIGDLRVSANFESNTLDGTISNLVNGDDERVSGSGTLNGSFVGSAITADINGSATSGGETFSITDQTVGGEFRGDGASAIYIEDSIEIVSSSTGAEDIFVTAVASR